MANFRYVSANERSRALCHGAYLYAQALDTTHPDNARDVERWAVWQRGWGADMAHRARAIQSCAFNVASCWDLYEGCGS